MEYTEVRINVADNERLRGQLMATMLEKGFDSFQETHDQLIGYISHEMLDSDIREAVAAASGGQAVVEQVLDLPDQNWNALWESNYSPILVGNRCLVRAPFHAKPNVSSIAYDIVIQPKMSFGTAHHATTKLMIEYLLDELLSGKSLLDMGTGTGVLAILAHMKGAFEITAIDIDPWSYENATENFKRNHAPVIQLIQGDASSIPDRCFDYILANINRNILLIDIPAYDAHLAKGGMVLLSGFYAQDIETIQNVAGKVGWERIASKTMDDWCALKFVKVQ